MISIESCGHRRGASPFGLGDLEVLGGEPDGRPAAALHGVAHRADDVDRLLVAEAPLAGRAGDLARRAGVADVMVAAAAGVERREHAAQRAGAQPPQRARRELQAVAAAFEIALTLQLAFDAPQLVQVVNRLLAERSLDELLVDVVQAGAGVVLQRQVGQVVYLGELGECLGRV